MVILIPPALVPIPPNEFALNRAYKLHGLRQRLGGPGPGWVRAVPVKGDLVL